jgi:hypothetical protein
MLAGRYDTSREDAMGREPLSEAAVALLRFRVMGRRFQIREPDHAAYQELINARIMESDGDDYKFTDEGWARREEILREEEERIECERFDPPDGDNLSQAARELVSRRLAGDDRVTAENLEAYRELAAARIMYPVSTWAGGPESVFRFTPAGWERRDEWVNERAVALHP